MPIGTIAKSDKPNEQTPHHAPLSRDMLDILINNSPIGMLVFMADKKKLPLIAVNDVMARTLKITSDKLLSTFARSSVKLFHASSVKDFSCYIDSLTAEETIPKTEPHSSRQTAKNASELLEASSKQNESEFPPCASSAARDAKVALSAQNAQVYKGAQTADALPVTPNAQHAPTVPTGTPHAAQNASNSPIALSAPNSPAHSVCVQLLCADKTPVWFECSVKTYTLYTNITESSPVFVASFVNINDLQTKEAKLNEQMALISTTKANLIQELEYERYLRQITSEFYDHIFEIDLTHNSFIGNEIDSYLEELGIDKTLAETYDQFLKYVAKATIHADSRKKYLKLFSRENLIKSFRDGQNSVSIQCLACDKNKAYYWVEVSIRIFYHGASDTIRCITYRKNIDELKRHEISLLEKAQKDSLTQLYNKRTTELLIDSFLVSSVGKSGKHALIMLDLDNFKKVNDSLGHAFGDKVLLEFSQEITKSFRDIDILGRIGGDEFVVLLKNYGRLDMLKKRATVLCETLAKSYSGRIERYNVSASLGIALFPEHGNSYSTLQERADHALYYSKGHGKNTFTVYSADITGTNSHFLSDRNINELINSSTDGIGKFAFDEKLSILYYNRELLSLFGYDSSRSVDSTFTETLPLIHKDDQTRVMQTLKNAFEKSALFSCTYRLINTHGSAVHVKVKGVFTGEKYKDTYPIFYMVYTDITELALLNQELALRQQKLMVIHELTDDFVYEYTPETHVFAQMGDSGVNIIGNPELVPSTNKAADFIDTPEVQQKNRAVMREVLATKQDMFAVETRLVSSVDGSIPVRVYGKRLYNNEDNMIQVIGKITSMAQQEKQAQELAISNRMLVSLNTIATLLISSSLGAFDDRINRTLSILGETLDIDSICIWKTDTNDEGVQYAVVLYEWTRLLTGFKNALFSQQSVSAQMFDEWLKRLCENTPYLYTRDGCTDPKDESYLVSRGLESAFVVPIHINGKLWGSFDFGDSIRKHGYTDQQIKILKTCTQLITSSIEEYFTRS